MAANVQKCELLNYDTLGEQRLLWLVHMKDDGGWRNERVVPRCHGGGGSASTDNITLIH